MGENLHLRKDLYQKFVAAFNKRYKKHMGKVREDDPEIVKLFCEFKVADRELHITPERWFEWYELHK